MLLKDKVCIVTGASGHLGTTVVDAFLDNGAQVFGLTGSKSGKSSERRNASNLRWLPCDALSEPSVRQCWETVRQESGRLDVLINLIGGIYPWSVTPDIELDVWKQTVDLNLTTAFLCTRESLRVMVPQRSGKILNVGALSGLHGSAMAGPYGAAKAALVNFTQTVADESRPHNIQVNIIIPGIIDTPANRSQDGSADTSTWVKPVEIAEVLVFLASERSACVTGSVVKVTGRF